LVAKKVPCWVKSEASMVLRGMLVERHDKLIMRACSGLG